MKTITYTESCNMFFAPVDEIIEALGNNEGLQGLTSQDVANIVKSDAVLSFYVENFSSSVVFDK